MLQPQELELQAAVQSLKQVLGTELGPSERALGALKPPSNLSRPGSYSFLWWFLSPVCTLDLQTILSCVCYLKSSLDVIFLGFSINNHSGKSTAPLNRDEKHENRTRQNKQYARSISELNSVSLRGTKRLSRTKKGCRDAECRSLGSSSECGAWARQPRTVHLKLLIIFSFPTLGVEKWKLREMAPDTWGYGSKMRRLICL